MTTLAACERAAARAWAQLRLSTEPERQAARAALAAVSRARIALINDAPAAAAKWIDRSADALKQGVQHDDR